MQMALQTYQTEGFFFTFSAPDNILSTLPSEPTRLVISSIMTKNYVTNICLFLQRTEHFNNVCSLQNP